MSIIELKDIVKIYNENKSNAVKALNGVNLSIQKGESVAIMGVSGSGKSTLLHILGCLDNSTSGTYLLDGEDISSKNATQLASIRNQKIGFVLQSYGLIETDTIYNNVKLPLLINKLYKAKDVKPRVLDVLKKFGLLDMKKKKVRELSGGQRQRVAIARALVNDADIILADEPTSALDSYIAGKIMNLFLTLNKIGKTIIIVTHDQKVAEMMSRTVHIVDGKIVDSSEIGSMQLDRNARNIGDDKDAIIDDSVANI